MGRQGNTENWRMGKGSRERCTQAYAVVTKRRNSARGCEGNASVQHEEEQPSRAVEYGKQKADADFQDSRRTVGQPDRGGNLDVMDGRLLGVHPKKEVSRVGAVAKHLGRSVFRTIIGSPMSSSMSTCCCRLAIQALGDEMLEGLSVSPLASREDVVVGFAIE